MPAPEPQALSTSAKRYFSSQNIALPMHWQPMGELFPGAFAPPELATPANAPTSLYHEPTRNHYHTGAARILSSEYGKFIDGICAAMADAIDKWMKIASVVSLDVVGPVGTLMPGGVSGPELYPLIMADAPRQTPSDRKYSHAVAAALSEGWYGWQQGLSGILNYPGFTGAPMPNIPVPLITLASEAEAGLAADNLSRAMERHLDDPGALHASTLFASVADAFYTQFQVFKTATLVIGVTVVAAAPPAPPAAGAAGAPDAPVEEEAGQDEPIAEAEEAPQDEAADPEAAETGDGQEAEEEENTLEPEEPLPPPPPLLAGMVIPTPGNFV